VKELGMSLLKVLNRLNQLFIFSWANWYVNLFEWVFKGLDVKSLLRIVTIDCYS
jgi:hypothetical protein